MAIAPLHPGYLKIDRHLTASLQFQVGAQIDIIILEHVGTREGHISNTEATESGVRDAML